MVVSMGKYTCMKCGDQILLGIYLELHGERVCTSINFVCMHVHYGTFCECA